jgi:EAL domain-containing protein (putative c-di-GMP-specific phosphodiesterase class I)
MHSIKLAIQPAYNYATGKIEYAEVLIRQYLGIDNVEKILHYVNANNLEVIFDIDVLRETLRLMNSYDNITYPIGVNLCPVTAEKPGIADRILLEIDCAKVKHEAIIIELNEGTDFSNKEVKKNAQILRDAGVKVALDDFGIKNANLYSLLEGCVDIVKIDRAFVECKSAELEQSQTAVLTTIKMLCDKLNLKNIVEGIETKNQLEKIQKMGYSVVQGYLYRKPFEFNESSLNEDDSKFVEMC